MRSDLGVKYISSPLNYTGGKYRLLPQIMPLFPLRIRRFVDLFCGGGNVGVNARCENALLNDSNPFLIGLFRTFQKLNVNVIIDTINVIIDEYDLSRTDLFGYEHYGCNSSSGVGTYNKIPFLELRQDFNKYGCKDSYFFMMLYVLIVYSFNNQIRFNRNGEFNLPVGKRDFNSRMQYKLITFVTKLQSGNYTLRCSDFSQIDLSAYDHRDFIYADPPYLITTATYNEQNAWNESNEVALLSWLEKADKKGIPFALSNVLSSNGKTNKILSEWISLKKNWRVLNLDFNYSNSSYHKMDRQSSTNEVLVINY